MINVDWAADVRKYAPDADDVVVAGIVRYCGIALRTRDASLVAFSDPKETARVRNGYCRKKLGLTDSDAVVDAAIAAVGEQMKADTTKNRVTVYYLLAERFGKLDLFQGKSKRTTASSGAAKVTGARGKAATAAAKPAGSPARKVRSQPAKVAAASAVPLAAASAAAPAAATLIGSTPSQPASTAPSSRGRSGDMSHQPGGGFMFATFIGVVALIIVAALLAWFISSRMGAEPGAGPAPVAIVAPAPAPAPVAAATLPDGAGVVTTEIDGRPMVSVYFDTARADLTPDFATATAPIKAWIDAHPGDRLTVSGFNDPSGDAAFNADLSRRRAQAVAAALTDIGISRDIIDLERPAETSDASVDMASARRVEISVKPAG